MPRDIRYCRAEDGQLAAKWGTSQFAPMSASHDHAEEREVAVDLGSASSCQREDGWVDLAGAILPVSALF